MKKYFLLFFFSFFLIQSACLQAANFDTSFKFSTIESEHFKVHYHAGLETIAKQITTIAEEEHPRLVKTFGWTPENKTDIVIIDEMDITNGSATSLPRNIIRIFPVFPSSASVLSGHDDWLRLLFIHEYSHILSLDSARGYSKVMRSIFGKPVSSFEVLGLSPLLFFFTVSPNNYLPSWWHEGIATWSETEFTPAGRGRSSYFDMIYRMAISENNIPSIDQINGDMPDWPGGSMPYIFGLALQKYMIDQYGIETVAKLNKKHAGRVPYFINGAAEQLFDGKSYLDLYQEMVDQMQQEQSLQIQKLQTTPLTEMVVLDLKGQQLNAPRYSPNGKFIVYQKQDPHQHSLIMVANSDGSNEKVLTRVHSTEPSLSWSSNGEKIYFSQIEVNHGFNIYQDLYHYDLVQGRLNRMTNGLRLREPDVSPDGKQLVAVMNSRGQQSLVILPADSNHLLTDPSELKVISDEKFTAINSPRWSPDGRSIVYTAKNNEGSSRLFLYHIDEDRHELLQAGYFEISHPDWTGDGQEIIYSSDKTGVFNIYVYRIKTEQNIQLTHLLGGAFQPDISADGQQIIFSNYQSTGFSLATVNFESNHWSRPTPVTIQHAWKSDYYSKPDQLQNQQIGPFKTTPYSVLPSLAPTFWFPVARTDHQGDVFGLFSAGQDVLGYNRWFLEYAHGIDSKENYYNATYVNNSFYPTLTLKTYNQSFRYVDYFIDGYEKERKSSVALSFPLNRLESNHFFTLGYEQSRAQLVEYMETEIPENSHDFKEKKNNFFASYYFSNRKKYPYSISPEEGYQLKFTFRNYGGISGGDLKAKEYLASFSNYLKMPWAKHHVLYANVKIKRGHGEKQYSKIGGSTGFEELPLRGYPRQYYLGKYAATGTLEYRLPLSQFFSGSGTSPLFYKQLHAAFFIDQDEVWESGFPSGDDIRTSAGFEIAMDLVLGYQTRISPALGFAHGFDRNGKTMLYFRLQTDI
ncbi:MAG: peptidase S9 [Gammaproteobacteria bacterium]|nr:peptidase S9 [Gammaproteobacteria bacterium]